MGKKFQPQRGLPKCPLCGRTAQPIYGYFAIPIAEKHPNPPKCTVEKCQDRAYWDINGGKHLTCDKHLRYLSYLGNPIIIKYIK